MNSYRKDPVKLLLKAFSFYRMFKRSEKWSRDELEAYQLKKLQEMVDYAFNHVPYYREAYSKAGFKPGDIKSFSDFQKLPFLTKDSLRQLDPNLFLSDEASKLSLSYIKTSGSTGVPLSFACDLSSRAANYAATYRAVNAAGYHIGAVQLRLKNFPELKSVCSFSKVSRQMMMHSYHLEDESLAKLTDLLVKYPPKHILAHPNALLELGTRLKDVRSLFRKTKGITSMGEVLIPEVRKNLEEIFGCKVYDYYSNMECSIMAYQIEQGEYIFNEIFCYPEIEGQGDDPLSGELTTTAFHSYAMPLIRYRNQDFVNFRKADASDSCKFLHVGSVCGRVADRIKLPSGVSVGIFSLLRADLTNVKTYQFVQTATDAIRVDYIPIDPSKGVNEASMLEELSSYVGNEVKVSARSVESLQKNASGKVPRAIVIKE